MKYAVQVTSTDGANALPPLVVEADSEDAAKVEYIAVNETDDAALAKAGLDQWTVVEGDPLGLADVEESDDDGTKREEGLNAPDGLGVAK